LQYEVFNMLDVAGVDQSVVSLAPNAPHSHPDDEADEHGTGHRASATPPALDDELAQLIPPICVGCSESFARLYALTSTRLFGIVLRINSTRPEAEELLQDIYLKVWTGRARFDLDKGSVMGWLTGIARYAAIDSLRRRHTRPEPQWEMAHVEVSDCYAECPSSTEGPVEAMVAQQLAQAIQYFMAELPAGQKRCLALALYDGMSHSEISQHLGLPLGTVKSWLRRALDMMRPALAHHR
jgi:RNA polymerase sigma-70 factor (ECF subfamily)